MPEGFLNVIPQDFFRFFRILLNKMENINYNQYCPNDVLITFSWFMKLYPHFILGQHIYFRLDIKELKFPCNYPLIHFLKPVICIST